MTTMAAPSTSASLAMAPVAKASGVSQISTRSFVSGTPLRLCARVCSAARVTMEAETTEAPKTFSPPSLNPDTASPIFGGSTGGLLRKAQEEEFYVITWDAPKEQIFELPTGGAAIMRSGENLLKLARKEQCLALGFQLKSKFKIDYQFYRVFPNSEVQYLHPKDGVYPEKVNPGRAGTNVNYRSIGENVEMATVKFSGQRPSDL